MTYKTHTQNISEPGNIPKDRIATDNLQAILRMLEDHILMGGEDAIEIAIRIAPTYCNYMKCFREMDSHNLKAHEKNPKNLQEHNTDEADNSLTPEDDAAARAALADALFKLQHAAVNEAAMERSNPEDEPLSI